MTGRGEVPGGREFSSPLSASREPRSPLGVDLGGAPCPTSLENETRKRVAIDLLESRLSAKTPRDQVLRAVRRLIDAARRGFAAVSGDLRSYSPHRASRLESTDDRYMRPHEAAEMLGASRQYFYRHEHELPFVVRLPDGSLRVSRQDLVKWLRDNSPNLKK